MEKYNHKDIEAKQQKKWWDADIDKVGNDPSKPKCYVLDMFPYPSGEGLHVGHPKGYIATDIYSRLKKMQGHNILHPMGWDAFGLPAENYALKNKIHPKVAVDKNIATFKAQLKKIGFNYDWEREINTTDPEYYKWTQWIFLKLFEKGLAYESFEPINWCPSCQTGLANEDLENGKCERCGSEVEKKPMRQWVLKITDYADRLLKDLDSGELKWPEYIKESQRNWIGRSEGAEVSFQLSAFSFQKDLTIFTTRADTIYGVTFVAIAPEVADQWLKAGWEPDEKVKKYIGSTSVERAKQTFKDNPEKTGIFSGIYAINPANNEEVPVWITNYVLAEVGTGAVMAVPAHDERDWEFAKKYNLPVKQVIMPSLVDLSNPPQEGKEETFRQVVLAVVYNPKTDKYLVLKWKNQPWVSFITGGVEDSEDRIEAAEREITEETGYKNLKLIRSFGMTEAFFFAAHKNVNRKTHAEHLFFELLDEERGEISDEEKNQHEAEWVSLDELSKIKLQHAEAEILLRKIKTGNDSFVDDGILLNSGEFDGLTSEEARRKITAKFGKVKVTYKLKDWVFSRQRYWGEPIPIIHCEKCGAVPVPENELPVKLPEVEHYEPAGTGESPLANINDWVKVKCPKCGGEGRRETNTMPQWAGSCWYYLAYCIKNIKAKSPASPAGGYDLKAKSYLDYWNPVDVYVGGAEHATRHLIYARFWHKFLYDLGIVANLEPFTELHNVGLILAEDGKKMSKRYGNVINPDEIVELYGADSLRLYTMFMGPFGDEIAWSTKNIIGVRRFLEKVWRLKDKVNLEAGLPSDLTLHSTIKKVTDDILNFRFNTAVSAMMIQVNAWEKLEVLNKEDYETLLKLLAPFAPHAADELWEQLGHTESIHLAKWPEYDINKTESKSFLLVVQVAGKVRATIPLSAEASEAEAKSAALNYPEVAKWLTAGQPSKVVYVPGRVINLIP